MKRACELQVKMQEAKKAACLEEEEKIRAVLLAKFAEDDRLEQLHEHKRRMKVEAHKREANRLLELRKQAYEQQREAERQAILNARDEEGDRQAIINEERQKLLKEHAIPLRDFLPKCTLSTNEDYEFVFGY